eukprot:jgi/Botrbrau1/23249/Bobra.0623s0001.1
MTFFYRFSNLSICLESQKDIKETDGVLPQEEKSSNMPKYARLRWFKKKKKKKKKTHAYKQGYLNRVHQHMQSIF